MPVCNAKGTLCLWTGSNFLLLLIFQTKWFYGIDSFINLVLHFDFCTSNYLMVCNISADMKHWFSCCPSKFGMGYMCLCCGCHTHSQPVRTVRKIWNPVRVDSSSCLDCQLRRCMYKNFEMCTWMSFCRNVLKWLFSIKSRCSPMNFKSVFHNIKMLELLRKQQ